MSPERAGRVVDKTPKRFVVTEVDVIELPLTMSVAGVRCFYSCGDEKNQGESKSEKKQRIKINYIESFVAAYRFLAVVNPI